MCDDRVAAAATAAAHTRARPSFGSETECAGAKFVDTNITATAAVYVHVASIPFR